MRIGMILDKTFPPDPRVENEAHSLIQNNHEVYLFCLKYGKEEEFEELLDIKVCRYSSNKLEYKLSAFAYTIPFYSFFLSKKINSFLLDYKIDAIHIHDIVIAEATFKANKSIGLPMVLDLHENRPEIMKLYPHLQKFPGKQFISVLKWKQKEEEFIGKVNKVIVVTKEAKKEIEGRINLEVGKINIVPNSVKKSFYSNLIIDNRIKEKYSKNFVILYLGDTGIRRGLQTAIDAVLILKDKIKNLKLVIVGSNSSDQILKNQVEHHNIQNYVDFEGWQNEKLFPSYIMASKIGISPLHRNLHHDTTYANKIFQYMSFGKPVLVSDAIAQKNLIHRTKSGLVHQEKNVVDFTDKVLELYKDKNLRSTLGQNGFRFVEQEFCWEKVSENLITLYDDLI